MSIPTTEERQPRSPRQVTKEDGRLSAPGARAGGVFRSQPWLALISLGSNLAGLALPLVLIHVYDRIIPNQAHGTALVLFSAVVAAILCDGFLRYARSMMLARRGVVAEHALAMRLATGLLAGGGATGRQADARGIEERFAGIARSRDVLVGQSALAFYDAPFAVLFLGLCWLIGGHVVTLPIAVVVVASAVALLLARPYRAAGTIVAEATHLQSGLVQDAARSPEMLRAEGLAGDAMERMRQARLRRAAASERLERSTALLVDLTQIGGLAITMAVVAVGAVLALQGTLTTGGLGAVTMLASRGGGALIALACALARRGLAAQAYRELQEHLAPPERHVASGTKVAPPALRLTRGPSTVAIEAGRVTVLDGETTEEEEAALASIAEALWPGLGLAGGWTVVLADDGRPLPPAQIGQAAMVHSRPTLFGGTILENLTLFNDERTDLALQLSRRLGLDAMVGRLAQGYRTPVGREFRSVLSPGAVKRVALVRALTQCPALLLIDRPTVAMDRDGIAALAALLVEKRGEMTVVLTSRSSALREIADHVAELGDAGRHREAA